LADSSKRTRHEFSTNPSHEVSAELTDRVPLRRIL
jgi:hypothetical protein